MTKAVYRITASAVDTVMSDPGASEQHPYAGHPATAVLADHVAVTTARGAGGDRKVRCTCDAWAGRDYDHAAHLGEVLHRAGLLADGPPPRDADRTDPRREGQ